jgi:cell division protein DivIC
MAINQTSNEVIKSKMERVKKFLKYFRNKYLLTMTLFTLYALFLDDQDMFTLIVQKSKLNKIEADQILIDEKLANTTRVLKQLNYTSELERYAREEKLFKKDDEDIFIISNE